MLHIPLTIHLAPGELKKAASFLDRFRPQGMVTPADDLANRLVCAAVLNGGLNTPAARRVLQRDITAFNRTQRRSRAPRTTPRS